INIALMKGSYDNPVMADFVAQLDSVNGVADASSGFIWRMQGDDEVAVATRIFGEPRMLINMSVWESIEALRCFVYHDRHLGVFRDRHRWCEKMNRAHLALWWVPIGHVPTVDDGKVCLDRIDAEGPTARAFTFSHLFPPPRSAGGFPYAGSSRMTGLRQDPGGSRL
ncbi:MAG: DUF3291 domain-containing protein, partial [Gammaproteobacteria bacterium]